MNHYTFEDINIGDEVTFEYDLDEKKMNAFLAITGDINPLHNDLDYAKEKGYTEKVVYGMLSASALSTLAGVYLPGEHSLIHSVEISFIKPVFLSKCPLKVQAKVTEKDDRFLQMTIKYVMFDQTGDKVCKGLMKIGFVK